MPLTYLNDFIRMSLSNLWFLNLIAIGFFFFFLCKIWEKFVCGCGIFSLLVI